jgi:hypothetical protein
MRYLLTLVSAAALLATLAGCATTPAERNEKLLTQSGFKAVAASTASQQQQMHTLPPAKISLVKRKGRTYYVYPDHARNILYVGNRAQYQAYQVAAQDQYLSQDAKLVRDSEASPALNQDSLEMTGAVPTWEQMWQGWPE